MACTPGATPSQALVTGAGEDFPHDFVLVDGSVTERKSLCGAPQNPPGEQEQARAEQQPTTRLRNDRDARRGRPAQDGQWPLREDAAR